MSAEKSVLVFSFGAKWESMTVDWLFDCREIENPHRDEEPQGWNGLHPAVAQRVLSSPKAQEILRDAYRAVVLEEDERDSVSVAFMCSFGRHRSVAVAEEFTRRLRRDGFSVVVEHLDIGRKE